MRRLLPPPGTVLLTGAVLLAGWSLIGQEHSTELLSRAITDAPLDGTETPLPREWQPTRNADAFYRVIEERPLFSEARRPQRPEAENADLARPAPQPRTPRPTDTVVAIKPPQLRLKGLMVDATHRSALIERPKGEARWYTEQTEIDGWVIDEISTRGVQLTRENKVHRITLYETD